LGLVLPGVLMAQFYDDPGLGNKPVASHPQDYKPLGVRAGSFMLHPGVQLAGQWTDNVFYTKNDKRNDFVYHIRPYITAQSTWSRHSLSARLAADIARYNDYSSRHYADIFFNLSGRIDVKNRSYFSYGLSYLKLHEDLNNRTSEQGIEPTRYKLGAINVGYDHTFNRLSLGVRYTFSPIEYDDTTRIDGENIDNSDRDRWEGRWFFRAGYQFQTEQQVFVSFAPYRINYDDDIDRNGFDRSGSGYQVNAGIGFNITGKLNGSISANYNNRDYDDPQLPSVNGWGGSAGLAWTPTLKTTVYGLMATSVQETTNEFSSGSLQRIYSVRVDHSLTRSWQLNGFLAYRDVQYQLIDGAPEGARENDDVYRVGVGASYFINRHVFLNGSYSWEKLKSSPIDDGYTVNRIWLTLGLEY
jgi:hypothetical protein